MHFRASKSVGFVVEECAYVKHLGEIKYFRIWNLNETKNAIAFIFKIGIFVSLFVLSYFLFKYINDL